MKKIFMLLFSTAVLSSAFAQSHRDYDDRNTNNNQTWNGNNNQPVFQKDHNREDWKNNNVYQRDRQIQAVTSQYDFKIQQVSYNRSLNRRQRRRIIENLESEKGQEISRIIAEYNSRAFNGDRNRNFDRSYGNGNYNR